MRKLIFILLLPFHWFLTFESIASQEDTDNELQAQQKQVLYIQLHENKHEIYKNDQWVEGNESTHVFNSTDKPTLTCRSLNPPNCTQFVLKHVKFKSQEHQILFMDPTPFLDKIQALSPTGSKKYNHLCLTLYATYTNTQSGSIQVVESPLYARWKSVTSLNENGNIEQISTVEFYTRTDPHIDGQWAYFMSGSPTHHNKALTDNNVFPIKCTSCYQTEYTPICKKFYKADTDDDSKIECSFGNGSLCSDTEPNALFHVLKHKNELFKPLIDKANGTDNIHSVGIRFFSYYESCTNCLSFLDNIKTKHIPIGDSGDTFRFNFIFYFHINYSPDRVINIKRNSKHDKRFTNLHNEGNLLTGMLQLNGKIKEEIGPERKVLGHIPLATEINIDNVNKILLVHPLPDENINAEERSKIYVTTYK